MALAKSWVQTALKVTGHFEDSTDPLGGVSGDFDGMGISVGVLQWNIGMGSLQPLVKNLGRAAVVDTMPVFGGELWKFIQRHSDTLTRQSPAADSPEPSRENPA